MSCAPWAIASSRLVRAITPRPEGGQAQQAFAPVLQQIGKTTDPDALTALAQALQALAAKLAEAQAQQAFR